MTETEFTPLVGLVGGAIIGVSFVLYTFVTGRGGGISSMYDLAIGLRKTAIPHFSFLLGLFAGGLAIGQLYPPSMDIELFVPNYVLVIGGLLVGYGTSCGGGCTSGHGVIGNGRFSPRALVATITFLTMGILSASFFYSILGVHL